jgi:hypothetical protein
MRVTVCQGLVKVLCGGQCSQVAVKAAVRGGSLLGSARKVSAESVFACVVIIEEHVRVGSHRDVAKTVDLIVIVTGRQMAVSMLHTVTISQRCPVLLFTCFAFA